MNVGVVGSRSFNDYPLLEKTLNNIIENKEDVTIVSGGARGADTLAERYANENQLELVVFKAEWDKYGKGAGFIRNKVIWDNMDICIAFWDGKSKGTKHSIDVYHNTDILPFILVEYNKKLPIIKSIEDKWNDL
jgi:hypothetical protein